MYLLTDPKQWRLVPVGLLLLCAFQAWGSPGAGVHHNLQVQLESDRIVVEDHIQLKQVAGDNIVEFLLGEPFVVNVVDAELLEKRPLRHSALQRYRVRIKPDSRSLTLRYQGRLSPEEGHSPSAMPALVYDRQGVYLDGSSGWYPRVGDGLMTFSLLVEHPTDWTSISQGDYHAEGEGRTRWTTTAPQDDIYLLAGPYHYYEKKGEIAKAQVFLLSKDAGLASRYLEVTERYLDLYSRLLGPYPFSKFAAVENRWQTGFGMPSFTLLGSRVMRFPFILASSYPHEIVHNWLGNSVYPDYARGNWSEGLTSYLADHLLQEQQGGGARYRRGTLQKYADYVSSEEKDFPIRRFRSRHDGASQAVGYGKTLMMLHMLRRQLGDELFRQGLREIYQAYRFRIAGFDDLRRVFERVGKRSLAAFFDQWVERTGAPSLEIGDLSVNRNSDGGYEVSGELVQTQRGGHYQLQVPIAVTVAGDPGLEWKQVEMDAKRLRFSLRTAARPLRLDVDPRFDLFRKLSNQELPPSLGQIFGAPTLHLVLPSEADPNEIDAYRKLAQFWRQRFPHLTLGTDKQPLPQRGGVWLLGSNNRHAGNVLEIVQNSYRLSDPRSTRLAGEGSTVKPAERSLAMSVRNGPYSTLGWVVPDRIESIMLLARKLPHYGKYSYLTFAGERVSNRVKAEWPVLQSPLTRLLAPEGEAMGSLPAEVALIR